MVTAEKSCIFFIYLIDHAIFLSSASTKQLRCLLTGRYKMSKHEQTGGGGGGVDGGGG